jgi:hypothetical protein
VDTNECVNCPAPWMLIKGSCIQYINNVSPLTWNEARNKCNSMSAELMDVNYETHFEYVESFIESFLNNSNFPVFYVNSFLFLFKYKTFK